MSPSEPTLFRPVKIQSDIGRPPWYRPLFEDGRNAVTLISDRPAQSITTKLHSEHEFWIVIQGEYECLIREESYDKVSNGDVIIFPAGTAHSVRAVSETATRLVAHKLDQIGNCHQIGQESPPIHNGNHDVVIIKREEMITMSEVQRKHTIISDDRNSLFLIREAPGTASQSHWHFDFDEWWYLLAGKLDFSVGQNRPLINAIEGDVVFVPRGFKHQITTVSAGPSIRMPVTNPSGVHIWTENDNSAPPPRQ